MANIRCVYDVFSGNVNMSAYNRMRAWWSYFRFSGDTELPIQTIKKITFSHSHSSTVLATWNLAGRITLDNGTTFTSSFESHSMRSSVPTYRNVFTPETTVCSDGTHRLPTRYEYNQISRIEVVWDGNNDSINCKQSNGAILYWWIGSTNYGSWWWEVNVEFEDGPITDYRPEVHTFDIWRADSDGTVNESEGEYIYASIGCSMNDETGLDIEDSVILRLYFSSDGIPDLKDQAYFNDSSNYFDLSENIREYLKSDGNFKQIKITNSDGDIWSLGEVFYFALYFQCGEEIFIIQDRMVTRAHVPIHISGFKTGGLAIGQYSTSEDGKPKFECAYPMYITKDVTYGDSLPVDGEEGQLFFLIV